MRRGAWDIAARVVDMDLNGIYASLNFPSFLPGFAGSGCSRSPRTPSSRSRALRAWNDWHLEEWAGHAPGADHPAAAAVDARSRGRCRRGAPQRGAWVQGDDLLGGAAPARVPVAAQRLLGSVDAGVRGDRDGGVPARRVVGHVAGDRARRAERHRRCAVLRLRDVRRGRLVVLAHPGALSRTSRSACRRVGSAGWPA